MDSPWSHSCNYNVIITIKVHVVDLKKSDFEAVVSKNQTGTILVLQVSVTYLIGFRFQFFN